MATMHFTETMTATPEQFIAALTDFGPDRSKVWGNSSGNYLKVHSQGATEADVTEGSAGVWERLHYDWSDPSQLLLRTTDSNAWSDRSGWTYSFSAQADGTTKVDVQVIRVGKNIRGRGLALALEAGGKRIIQKRFRDTIKAIDAYERRDSDSAT